VTEVIIDFRNYYCSLDEKQKNFSVNCHILCRILVPIINQLEIIDGYYIGINLAKRNEEGNTTISHCNHSWLQTNDGSIIDVYPVGFITMTPILVASKGVMSSFGKSMYVEDPGMLKPFINRDMYRNVEVGRKRLKESIKKTKVRLKND